MSVRPSVRSRRFLVRTHILVMAFSDFIITLYECLYGYKDYAFQVRLHCTNCNSPLLLSNVLEMRTYMTKKVNTFVCIFLLIYS